MDIEEMDSEMSSVSSLCMILQLPRDILVHKIFMELDLRDLAALQLTCKDLYLTAQEERVWRRQLLITQQSDGSSKSILRELIGAKREIHHLVDELNERSLRAHQEFQKNVKLEIDLQELGNKLSMELAKSDNMELEIRNLLHKLETFDGSTQRETEIFEIALQKQSELHRKEMEEYQQNLERKNKAQAEQHKKEMQDLQKKLEKSERDNQLLENRCKQLSNEVKQLRNNAQKVSQSNQTGGTSGTQGQTPMSAAKKLAELFYGMPRHHSGGAPSNVANNIWIAKPNKL